MTHSGLRNTLGIGVGVSALAFVITITILLIKNTPLDWDVILTFLGSALATIVSFVFLKQKQDIEELQLFKQLFADFNERYDGLNDDLIRILLANPDNKFSHDERMALYDYFNLCGEEYLYFQKGYIFPEVWKAWCNGIKFYLNSERIRPLWLEEERMDSYYGLTLKKIEQYALANKVKS